MRRKARKKRLGVGKIILFFFIIMVLCGGAVFAYTQHMKSFCAKYDNVIYPGVEIQGMNFSEKTKEQALQTLKQKFGDSIKKKNIVIKTPEKEYKINYSNLNARYNIQQIVQEAFAYGKGKDMKEKFDLLKDAKLKKFSLKFDYDDRYVDTVIKKVESEVNETARDASITKSGLENTNFKVASGMKGQALNKDKLKKDILSKINGDLEGDVQVQAEIKTLQPKVSTEKLKSINSKISTFKTHFTKYPLGRATNIEIGTRSVNGTVVMPGEVFSFNEVVGDSTADKGYQPAAVIIGNKVSEGLGGGICQVSTTLYNAALRANIQSIERAPHTFPSSYVQKGADATIAYGSTDYKFKNNFKYPIYIESYVNNGDVIFNIYSNSSLKGIRYEIKNEIVNTINPTTKYINDPSLPKGKQVIETRAATGYKVKLYRIGYKNGKEVSREELHTDNYPVVNGVIRRGTKE